MDYLDLITKIIEESGLTHEEITNRCEADGVFFNYNYISTIKNRLKTDISKTPGDDISRAIARACGRHEDLLVTQAYYDQSPKAFKDMLDSIIKIVKIILSKAFEMQSDEAGIRTAKKKLDEMAVAEWLEYDLSDISRQIDDSVAALMNIDGFEEVVYSLIDEKAEDVCSHIALDDSIVPVIPKGAQVYTMLVARESLKDGDYICYSVDDNDEPRIRQISFWEDDSDKVFLIPLDAKNYKREIIEADYSRLYEKVVQIVIDFD